MKKLAIIMLALAAAASATDLTGVWSGKGGREDVRYGTVPQTAQLALIQDGTSLSGTMKLNKGQPVKITSGSISGSQVVLAIVGPTGQVTGHFTQTGTQLSGKMTASNGQIYDFVFTKN